MPRHNYRVQWDNPEFPLGWEASGWYHASQLRHVDTWNWQPIETAPKDKRILLWWDDMAVTGKWLDGMGIWECAGWLYGQPTHWCELMGPVTK